MIEIRPLALDEIPGVIDYFLRADRDFLRLMGVEPKKLLSREIWLERLVNDFQKPDKEKSFFYLGWLMNNTLIGHSNINNITFGKEASIHLHLWEPERRKNGCGLLFFKKSIPYFATRFELKKVICEPNAQNQGPNKVLEKAGFTLIKKYQTTPGEINFEQVVNRWELSCASVENLTATTAAAP